MSHHPKDQVTCEFVAATRMGVHIRTPLENVTHFQADQKYVTAFTKTNGEFVLNVPLWEITTTLCHLATVTHRSYVVMDHALKGAKMFRPTGGNHYLIEVMATIPSIHRGGPIGLCGHEIRVARREVRRVRQAWEKANA